MAQIPKGRLEKGPYKPICRDCAIYFSITVSQIFGAVQKNTHNGNFGMVHGFLTNNLQVSRRKFQEPCYRPGSGILGGFFPSIFGALWPKLGSSRNEDVSTAKKVGLQMGDGAEFFRFI